MANKLIYSASNPIQLFSTTPNSDARYLSKDFEDFEFSETILPWEQCTNYNQPWLQADSIAQQLQTNVGPVSWVLKRCDGSVINTLLFSQVAESETEPGLYIYQILAPLAAYLSEKCYIEVIFGSPAVFSLRSGYLSILPEQPNTLLLEGKHFEFREDLIFETGFFPSLRVAATKKYKGPGNVKTIYEDQRLNNSVLRNEKYRNWILSIGGSKGVPDYIADIIGGLSGCSDFRVDGKNYVVMDELEPNGIDRYPMRGWSMTMRDLRNRASREYSNDTPINAQLTAIINVDSKGFGNSNSGSQTAIIKLD